MPRRLSHPSRKTIGLRVPEDAIVHALLEELQQPLLGTTLIMPGEEDALNDADTICERLGKQIELVIDGGALQHGADHGDRPERRRRRAGAPGQGRRGHVRPVSPA